MPRIDLWQGSTGQISATTGVIGLGAKTLSYFFNFDEYHRLTKEQLDASWALISKYKDSNLPKNILRLWREDVISYVELSREHNNLSKEMRKAYTNGYSLRKKITLDLKFTSECRGLYFDTRIVASHLNHLSQKMEEEPVLTIYGVVDVHDLDLDSPLSSEALDSAAACLQHIQSQDSSLNLLKTMQQGAKHSEVTTAMSSLIHSATNVGLGRQRTMTGPYMFSLTMPFRNSDGNARQPLDLGRGDDLNLYPLDTMTIQPENSESDSGTRPTRSSGETNVIVPSIQIAPSLSIPMKAAPSLSPLDLSITDTLCNN